MAFRNSVRTEKIVAAAALLFARQGYHGTSTREIARLAEVSENTLFRHFDHKEDIFWSALRSNAAALKPRRDLLEGIRAGDGPEVILPKILELLSDTVKYKPEVLRLIAVALLELQGKGEALCRDLISPLFSEISRYLASSVEKGQVMDVDPTILASSLMAMVLIHPQILKLTDVNGKSLTDRGDAVHAYSKFWLDVLSPRLAGISLPSTAEQTST
jgi:AcrR family transcriptional regulator